LALGLGLENGAWLGHLSMLLLVIAIAAPPVIWLRIGVAASALAGMGYALIDPGAAGLFIWQAALFGLTLAQLVRYRLVQSAARFSSEDEALRAAIAGSLPAAGARHLIDQGNWINGKAGEVLINEGEAISHLFYLHSGGAEVSLGGKPIAMVGAGELLGEATALSGAPATGTVMLARDSRFWCMSAPRLREYLQLHPDARSAIERQINAALDAKLRVTNQALAESA